MSVPCRHVSAEVESRKLRRVPAAATASGLDCERASCVTLGRRVLESLPALLVLLGLSALPARAQSPAPHANEECLACHGEPTATNRLVLPETYAESIHGQLGMACVDCHQDVATADFPHPEKLAPVQPVCATCHSDQAALYDQSAHAEALRAAPTSVAATCKDCHGTHDIKPKTDPESRVYHLNISQTCAACHGNADVIARGNIAAGNVAKMFADSIHGRALVKAGLMSAPACTDCHKAHDILRKTNPASPIFRTSVPATCGKCHEGVERQYHDDSHGAALVAGKASAPVCSDCHSAHQIQTADSGWKLQVMHECGNCHADSIRTYRDTYHGQVTALGYTRTAECADCHGAHGIYPQADPRSTVSEARIVSTCATCHEGATPQFVRYDPHGDKHNLERNPVLYYASVFMSSLLLFVFAFFGVHTTLWFSRSVRTKRARPEGGKRSAEEKDE
jgi:hypothetical protein